MSAPLHILLLGGSGFVGSALLRELASWPAGSVRVRALLRRPDSVRDYPFLDKCQGSLEALPADLAPAAPYVLVHLAVKHIDHDGSGFFATNVDATERLLSALGTNLRGILYASSMAVYGRGAQEGTREDEPLVPGTPLGESRRVAEGVILEAARQRGISAFVLRTRFVLGEGDKFVLPGLAKPLRRGLGAGSGEQRFSIVHVRDYARILLRLAQRTLERDAHGESVQRALNVGYAEPVRLLDIEAALAAHLSLERPRLRLPLTTFTSVLRRLPSRKLDQLATRLDLIGRSHWGDSRALGQEIGRELIEQDPLAALRDAAAVLST
jgi:nucleoside-diphosphate-sugar epimerase